MNRKYIIGFFILFTFNIFAEIRDTNNFLYSYGIGTIIKTDDKRVVFSFFSCNTNLVYPKIKVDVAAEKLNFFSDYTDYKFNLYLQTAKLGLSFKSIGLQVGVYDLNIRFANLNFNNAVIKEKNINNKIFSLGYNADYRFFKHKSNLFYGKGELSFNDLGSFIAKPFINSLWGTIQKIEVTDFYLFQFSFFNLDGNLKNKKDAEIAFYNMRFFEFKNKFYFQFIKKVNVYFFASYIQGLGNFNVRLTAGNQGYFLFPYVFYNYDIGLAPSFIGFGINFIYQTHRLKLSGNISFYSCIYGAVKRTVHSKEKNSFLFGSKEEFLRYSPLKIKGSHLLYIKLSSEYKLTKKIKLVIDKHLPIPFLSEHLSSPINNTKKTQINIDPFISGTSLSAIINL